MTPPDPDPRSGVTGQRLSLALWAFLFLVIAVRFAQPFLDGDLFWHMAYGRQMIARGTLVLDHTAFSWTPTANTMIYCAWASEVWFYWLWQHLGPWSLFALRYAVVLYAVALAAGYARRAGVARSIFLPALLMLMLLMSYVGTVIKAELFSYVFLNAVVCVYFRAKLARAQCRQPSAIFYAVPLLIVLWVNHHGGFALIAPFLAATALGEWLNARASRGLAFSSRSLKHMIAAWALCGVAVTLTPYGIRYPIQLFQDYALGMTPRPDGPWNAAYQAVFQASAMGLHFAEFLVILGATLLAAMVQLARTGREGARLDWALLIVNAVYLAIYLPVVRTTYFWPVMGTYSVIYLASLMPASRSAVMGGDGVLSGLAIGLVLFLGGRTIYEARYRPDDRAWLGFGTADMNPVAEAEFLAKANLGPRMYNTFDSGGYLLWRLDPTYKVMVDQRSFPYLSWFNDQYRFTRGEIFDEFLRKYPADLAVIDLTKTELLRQFLKAPQWRLVYFGPSAAVFVTGARTVPSEATAVRPDRFLQLRNPQTAWRVFDFAKAVGDGPVAQQALDQIETRHRWSLTAALLESAEAYRQAHQPTPVHP